MEREITVTARDGFLLHGVLVSPDGGPAKPGLLISTGTGIACSFYLGFARDAAARGFSCLVYDPRGIGGSAPADYGLAHMGHNGPFGSSKALARAAILDWLETQVYFNELRRLSC